MKLYLDPSKSSGLNRAHTRDDIKGSRVKLVEDRPESAVRVQIRQLRPLVQKALKIRDQNQQANEASQKLATPESLSLQLQPQKKLSQMFDEIFSSPSQLLAAHNRPDLS